MFQIESNSDRYEWLKTISGHKTEGNTYLFESISSGILLEMHFEGMPVVMAVLSVCHMCADRQSTKNVLFLFLFTTLLYSLSLKCISIYTLWSENSSILCPSIQGLVTSCRATILSFGWTPAELPLKATTKPRTNSYVCFSALYFWKTSLKRKIQFQNVFQNMKQTKQYKKPIYWQIIFCSFAYYLCRDIRAQNIPDIKSTNAYLKRGKFKN